MLKTNVEVDSGLEMVVKRVVGNDNPLIALAIKYDLSSNMIFLPVPIVEVRGARFDNVKNFIDNLRSQEGTYPRLEDKIQPAEEIPRDSLRLIREGRDYLEMPEKILKQAFRFGEQEYYLIDYAQNKVNTGFKLVLFPRETISIEQKRDMMKTYSYSNEEDRYEHVKTIIFKAGDDYFLALIRGKAQLQINSKSLRTAVGNKPIELTLGEGADIGRPRGAYSPFIHQPNFGNIKKVLFSSELLEKAYTEPHYELSIDKRSSLVISDLAKLYTILPKINNYPIIESFSNK